MAGFFVSASSQYLSNAAPPLVSTGYPLTMAAWVRPTGSGTARGIFAFADTGTSDSEYLSLQHNNVTSWVMRAQAAGAGTATTVGTIVFDAWQFLVLRFIDATNRRIAVLQPNGSTAHAQGTVSRTPAGLDQISIGQVRTSTDNTFFDGYLGEFWYTQTDIQPDGLQLQNSTLRQLAYGSPFSVPSIAKDILEYRSLRPHPTNGGRNDIYVGAGARAQNWTNNNVVTIAQHPPLPGWYAAPPQTGALSLRTSGTISGLMAPAAADTLFAQAVM